jgi:hypothetical protein
VNVGCQLDETLKYFKMNKMLKLILFSFFTHTAQSQLTVKDFKLCLDSIKCTDSVLLITKDELLKSKKITPNYSWFTIESATVYIGQGNFTSEIIIVNLPNNEFTPESRKKFERLKSGGVITIEVKGHNKQNVPTDWGTLSIKIIDKCFNIFNILC